VSSDYRLLNAERIKEPHYIADEMQQGVLIDRLRPVGMTIAAHVNRDSMESSRRQRGKLMPPRVPRLWKAVAQDDQRSLALFNEMEMNPICPDRAMRNAAGGLRVAQTRSADSPNSCHANEFTSLHR
jgi:hypothetical protein